MAMSELERALDRRIESSGVSRSLAPSIGERKRTPSSLILRSCAELTDLEAAGVGEDRPPPVHEAVQAAEATRMTLVARPQPSGGRCCRGRSARAGRRALPASSP
jgi:hypothetical protein